MRLVISDPLVFNRRCGQFTQSNTTHPMRIYPDVRTRSLNRHSEAEALYREALSIRTALLPDCHPDLAESYNRYVQRVCTGNIECEQQVWTPSLYHVHKVCATSVSFNLKNEG